MEQARGLAACAQISRGPPSNPVWRSLALYDGTGEVEQARSLVLYDRTGEVEQARGLVLYDGTGRAVLPHGAAAELSLSLGLARVLRQRPPRMVASDGLRLHPPPSVPGSTSTGAHNTSFGEGKPGGLQ